jgi:ribosomal silencing factor RsfS
MPTEKKARKINKLRVKPIYDVEHLTITIGNTPFNMAGLRSDVFTKLAMEGIYIRLKRAKDKIKAWEAIQSGEIVSSRPKRFPWPVLAIAEIVVHVSSNKINTKWLSLDKFSRRKFTSLPAVKAQIAALKAGGQLAIECPELQEEFGNL